MLLYFLLINYKFNTSSTKPVELKSHDVKSLILYRLPQSDWLPDLLQCTWQHRSSTQTQWNRTRWWCITSKCKILHFPPNKKKKKTDFSVFSPWSESPAGFYTPASCLLTSCRTSSAALDTCWRSLGTSTWKHVTFLYLRRRVWGENSEAGEMSQSSDFRKLPAISYCFMTFYRPKNESVSWENGGRMNWYRKQLLQTSFKLCQVPNRTTVLLFMLFTRHTDSDY